ncbi:HAD-IA family hydrolase [Motilibacter rhizosphaerae]|uniref:HAD-IA family hydrolase n=1 Tax=Motilibacter rhizosphaerae TaxID=598652 RepID=UPI0013EE7E58|nr:HAD-IA family hydrolase [Motilibacter rhizosphaerae]
MTRALLLDYGCVLSLPQPPDAVRALESVAPDVAPADFWRGYWDVRLAYDEGMADDVYLASVLGREPTAAEVGRFVELDTAGWLHLEERMTGVLPGLHERGVPVGLLSNAPFPLARALERQPWAKAFTSLTFSADLGIAKPRPEAYLAAARALGAEPAAVVFVDDRAENVAAADAVGMTGVHHTDVAETLALLDRLLQTGDS